MPTFGNTDTSGVGNSPIDGNINTIHTAIPASSGTLDSITAHLNFQWAARSVKNILAKAALYSVSGTTYALVSETTERTFLNITYDGVGYAWYQFDFASPPDIVGSVEYALAVWANDPSPATSYSVNLKYDTTSAFGLTIVNSVYNGFNTPYTQTPAALDPSIYGTYTLTPTGPPVGTLASCGAGR